MAKFIFEASWSTQVKQYLEAHIFGILHMESTVSTLQVFLFHVLNNIGECPFTFSLSSDFKKGSEALNKRRNSFSFL